jgi:Domain of unknown function (DUF4252)
MNKVNIKKNILIVVVLILMTPLSILAQSDAITKYFDKYLEDENFTVVYITPKMFQLISKLNLKDPEAQEIKNILQDLRGLRVLQTEHNAVQMYKEVINQFKPTEYDLLMTVRSKDDNVRFWTKESNGIINELLMIVGDRDEFTMISFIGNIDLNKISKLSENLKIDGIEHLKDLKDKKN